MFAIIIALFSVFSTLVLDFDTLPVLASNGNVYLNAQTGVSYPCQALDTPCKDISDFLNGNTSNYFMNSFYFATGTYNHPRLSVAAMAPSQTIGFIGQDEGVIVNYDATSSTYGFVVSMGAIVQYTRLTYRLNYTGSSSSSRTLIRTNGGMCYANNCTFTTSTASVRSAIFRNAYGGTINITRCVFVNIAFNGSADDYGCIYGGGSISGDYFAINCSFLNLSSNRGTPVLPIPGAGNISISGGLIQNITVPASGTIVHISSSSAYPHYSSIVSVTFSNITQDSNPGENMRGFLFSLSTSTLSVSSNVTIEGNRFINIVGYAKGGVLYSNATRAISLSHNTFTNCRTNSNLGGALFFDASSIFSLVDCQFTACGTITGTGGAIYINGAYNSGRFSISQCRFSGNLGSVGKDIYYNASSLWSPENFGSTCSDCQGSCFVNSNQETISQYAQNCMTEVYVTGSESDNANCAGTRLCGTIQYVLSLPASNYSFIGVAANTVSVSGILVSARNETITGDSVSSSILAANFTSTTSSAFTVDSFAALILTTLQLVHRAGGEFIVVSNGYLSIVSCEVRQVSDLNLTASFVHTYINTRTSVLGTTFSSLTFLNGSAFTSDGGSLTLSSSSFYSISTTGNGSCVNAKVSTAIEVISIEDSCVMGNCVADGFGGALYLNLSTGTSFALLSTVLFNNRAGQTGGAIAIVVSSIGELANLRFNNDVHFYENIGEEVVNYLNNVHLETPAVSHYCFTAVYNLRRYEYFDFTRWTFMRTATDVDTVSSVLVECVDRCGIFNEVNCAGITGCWFDEGRCVPHPCLDEYSGNTSPPCHGVCVLNEYSPLSCSIDGCTTFHASACAAHAVDGCGLVLGKCVKANVKVTPGLNKIKEGLEKLPSFGKVFLTEGTYDEQNIVIGVKELWIGNDGTLSSVPVIRETSISKTMIDVSIGGGIDINNLTLTTTVSNTNDSASLVFVTQGRLVLNYVRIQNRWGTYCAIYAEQPREVMILNCYFTNITHDTSKGGAGLGINLLGKNGYAQIANTTFQDVWVEGIAANTRFGGAVWLEAHGSGHTAEVILCVFSNISTTDNAGALELYSDDHGGSILCESTTFLDCYTTKGGGATSCRGKPVVIRNCTFTRCKAGTAGGAIYHGGSSDNYIEQCIFRNCSARNISSNTYGSGAIDMYTSGLVVMADCEFDYCFCEKGTSTSSRVDCLCVTITGYSNCTISRCVFTNNFAEAGSGGGSTVSALYTGASSSRYLFIQGCLFENNSGITGSNARTGAIHIYSVNLIFKNNTFKNNSGEYVGAVYLNGTNIVYFGNAKFENNAVNLPSSATRSAKDIYSTASLDKDVFEYVCFESGYMANTAAQYVSLPNSEVPTLESSCLGSTPFSTTLTAATADDLLNAINANVYESVNVTVTANITVPPMNVLSENISLVSENSSSSPVKLTVANNNTNIFTVSVGSLSIKQINIEIQSLGDEKSFVKLIGNGSLLLDGVAVSYIPVNPASSFQRLSNQETTTPNINTRVIYFEFGSVTIANSSFSNFVFGDIGNLIYFNPSSRGMARLNISNTNFSNIDLTSDAIDFEYPRFGVAIYASLLSATNILSLTNVSVSNTKGAFAIITPNLIDVEASFTASGVLFYKEDRTNVYYGTFNNELENAEGNDLCNVNVEAVLVQGGIGIKNVHLCLGGSTSCTESQTRTIEQLKAETCLPPPDTNGTDNSTDNGTGNNTDNSTENNTNNNTDNSTENNTNNNTDNSTENNTNNNTNQTNDSNDNNTNNNTNDSNKNDNNGPETKEGKKDYSTVIIVVIVVVAVIIVVAIVVFGLVLFYKLRLDKQRYELLEKQQSSNDKIEQMSSSTPSSSSSVTTTTTKKSSAAVYKDNSVDSNANANSPRFKDGVSMDETVEVEEVEMEEE